MTENLMDLGHEVFSFVDDPRNFVPHAELSKKPTFLSKADGWQTSKELRKLHERNLQGIQNADTVILLLPSGESSHIEEGIGFALGKKMILIGPVPNAEPHYLIFDEWFSSIEAYVANLKS